MRILTENFRGVLKMRIPGPCPEKKLGKLASAITIPFGHLEPPNRRRTNYGGLGFLEESSNKSKSSFPISIQENPIIYCIYIFIDINI